MRAREIFSVFRRPLDPQRRLGITLLASVLLHALMLLSLSKYAVHASVFSRPLHVPLSVRIENLPESPQATPVVINDRKSSLRLKLSAPLPVETTAPSDIEPSLPQPGVSVSDTLYVRPISGRVDNPLLATGEYRRASDINEIPEVVAIRAPEYPRPAREQKLSGWVIVMLFVDEEGEVVDTAAVDSSESFSGYASVVAQGLRGSVYTPGKLDGTAVKSLAFAMVRFDSKALSDLEPPKQTGAPVSVESVGNR